MPRIELLCIALCSRCNVNAKITHKFAPIESMIIWIELSPSLRCFCFISSSNRAFMEIPYLQLNLCTWSDQYHQVLQSSGTWRGVFQDGALATFSNFSQFKQIPISLLYNVLITLCPLSLLCASSLYLWVY